ncbi:carboxylesterase family protein [Tuwongella immobilis]|nr:prolyl oligopeptidase family serine peptidase [Tuwongella immobilis]
MTGFLNREFKNSDGTISKYVIFVPHDYSPEKPVPTILFLHGSGETGTDGLKQTTVGLPNAIRKQEKTFPFLTIMPQASPVSPVRDRWFAGQPNGDRAMAILKEVEQEFKVDSKRIYLTGLSMGGFGTWNLAAAYPKRFAAIVPVCGGGDPKSAEKIKEIPCWCFHGDEDKAVNVKLSREMIQALKAAGANPKYTEYPGVGHNSWDAAYGTAELYPWLLSHQSP